MNLEPAIDLLEEFEGCVLHAYKDAVGVWTIGYGTTVYPSGKLVKVGDHCTKEQAVEWMLWDIQHKRIPSLKAHVKVPLEDHEICALISFEYNVGNRALETSTLLKKLNANAPKREVADEFLKWTHAGGRVLAGLVRRRKAERQLFLSQPVVHAIEPVVA